MLNKFLSKTYHMIDQCDPSIASWSNGGDSFTVHDIKTFEQTVLPKYFNHSHFTSFTRQLNFYGFQKLRNDWDLQTKSASSNSVRFTHEYFKKDQPELLHKIQRATAGGNKGNASSPPSSRPSSPSSELTQQQFVGIAAAASNVEVESLQREVAALRKQLEHVPAQMEQKLVEAATALAHEHQRRLDAMEAKYEKLFNSVLLAAAASVHHSSSSRTSPMVIPTSPVPTDVGMAEHVLANLKNANLV